jgi:predicted deacylase
VARSTAESGLFRPAPDCEPGDCAAEGDSVGAVYDPATYERLQDATAGLSGVLYALTRRGTVTAGDRLAGIAVPIGA